MYRYCVLWVLPLSLWTYEGAFESRFRTMPSGAPFQLLDILQKNPFMFSLMEVRFQKSRMSSRPRVSESVYWKWQSAEFKSIKQNNY